MIYGYETLSPSQLQFYRCLCKAGIQAVRYQSDQQTLQCIDLQYFPVVMSLISKFIEPLQLTALDQLPALKFIQQKYGIKPSLAAILIFIILLVLSPFLSTHSLLTSIVCYLIPAFLSYKALETTDKEDDIRYLNYWVLFSLAELFTPLLRLFFNRFFYMIFRMAVTLLLLHPLSDLSLKFYNNLLRPFLLKHQKDIDNQVQNLAEAGKKKVLDGIEKGIKQLS